MRIKSEQVTELETQADKVKVLVDSPEKQDEVDAKRARVSERFRRVLDPLEQRKKELAVKKEVYQFLRDIEDENIWLEEKMNLISSQEYGSSLQDVSMLIKKNRTLRGEIENHEPRIMSVCAVGKKLIEEDHPDSTDYQQKVEDLKEKLTALKDMLEARKAKLLVSEKARQRNVERTSGAPSTNTSSSSEVEQFK